MKKYIRAMAMTRNKAIDRANYYSRDLVEHVVKIVLFHDIRKSTIPRWIGEIATWLTVVDNIIIKPHKKLKLQDIEDTLFGWMGTSINDYTAILQEFYTDNQKGKFNSENHGPYPEFDPWDTETATTLQHVCEDLISNTIELICSNDNHTRADYIEILNQVFEPYL